ncbi:MAG: hypothetical protein WDM86_01975 [Rhizomicrobium sp.]
MRRILFAFLLCGAMTGAARAAGYDDFARGLTAAARDDPDGAIAAFTVALGDGDLSAALVPQAYRGRARAYMAKGRCADALADLDAALKLKPGEGDLVAQHGFAAACLDKLDVALADYDALVAAKFSTDIYRARGILRWRMGDPAAAVADFSTYVSLFGKDPYGVLWLEMSRARAGALDPSVAADDVRHFDDDKWPGALLKLYAGKLKPDGIAAAVAGGDASEQADRQCEADFYLGEWWLTQADTSPARPLLQRARDTCRHDFIEWGMAGAELRRLK